MSAQVRRKDDLNYSAESIMYERLNLKGADVSLSLSDGDIDDYSCH